MVTPRLCECTHMCTCVHGVGPNSRWRERKVPVVWNKTLTATKSSSQKEKGQELDGLNGLYTEAFRLSKILLW